MSTEQEREHQEAQAVARMATVFLEAAVLDGAYSHLSAVRALRGYVHDMRGRIDGAAWRQAAEALDDWQVRGAAIELLHELAQAYAEEAAALAALVQELRGAADRTPGVTWVG